MTLQIAILALVLINVFLVLTLVTRGAKHSERLRKIKELENKINNMESFVPGCRVLIPNYGLSQTSTKTDFKVDYVAEVLEVSTEKIKINILDFTSNDTIANDPSMKNSIIHFMSNKWVEKDRAEIILDQSYVRDTKINKILS